MPFPNSVVYPFNFVNRRGIPLIESSGVEATESQVTITIANQAFRFLDDRGIFLFRLNQPIPEGFDDAPIIFSWTGFQQTFTQPLTLIGNNPATEEEVEGTGVYIIYYDKCANVLQLMTNGIGTEQTTNTTGN